MYLISVKTCDFAMYVLHFVDVLLESLISTASRKYVITFSAAPINECNKVFCKMNHNRRMRIFNATELSVLHKYNCSMHHHDILDWTYPNVPAAANKSPLNTET